MPYNETRGAWSNFEISQRDNEITIIIPENNRCFTYLLQPCNLDVKDVINKCLYNYSKTGEVILQTNYRDTKDFKYSDILKIVMGAINDEKNR